jgi:hypothetical protein
MNLLGDFCGDLTGDGVPEIFLTERSDGAHCCYTHYVFSMTSPPRRLLMWERGDAGIPIVPVKYRDGASWQLEGRVVADVPDPSGALGLSYATTPLVPAILSLEGGRYVLTSLSFLEPYRKQRDDALARCAKGADCSEATVWIDSLVIGDWDMVKGSIADTQTRDALDKQTRTMKAWLSSRLGSLARPVVPR